MKTHIIALTGYAGAGKDTVADLLVTHAGFRKLAFADALRAEVSEGFGIEPSYLTHPSTKHQPMHALAMRHAPRDFLAAVVLSMGIASTDHNRPLSDEWLAQARSPRQIMQWWGTEYRRAQHPSYWSRTMLNRLTQYLRIGEKRLAITDVRFDNEADAVRTADGLIWQVTRPGCTGSAEGDHASATDGSRFAPDAVIGNIHDLRHLQGVVLSEFAALELSLPRDSVHVSVPA